MFTDAKRELKELMMLTHEIATLDATLAANRSIRPEESYYARRLKLEQRRTDLTTKYELY